VNSTDCQNQIPKFIVILFWFPASISFQRENHVTVEGGYKEKIEMKMEKFCIIILIVPGLLVLPAMSVIQGKIAFTSDRDGIEDILAL
jgi:hypothetical protein